MPNRILKDSIRTSNKINKLSDFSFRVWTYLLTYVDDYGRGSADLDVLKGFCFPKRKSITAKNISDALTDLACIGLISLYNVSGEPYLCFLDWDKHQTIRNKHSKCPEPDQNNQSQELASNCKQLKSSDCNCSRNPIQYEIESEDKIESELHFSEVLKKFNEICIDLPKVTVLSDSRKKSIKSASKRIEDYGGWENFFKTVEHSDFLSGRNGAWTGCGFDWILKPANLIKIIEGNYNQSNNQSIKQKTSHNAKASYDMDAYINEVQNEPVIYKRKEEKNEL